MTEFSKLLSTKVADKARKIIDFYDGKQEHYIINQLSNVSSGRKDWKERGLIPRIRNITKMIINKSGMVFTDRMPNIEVVPEEGAIADEAQTKVLQQLLLSAEYEDALTNLDPIVRALNTARILMQWDGINQKFVFDILGLHNSATILDEYKNIITLVYRTSCEDDGTATYRVFTNELIQDLIVDKDGKESIVSTNPNPYGFIPLVTFHDTIKPRTGDYNEPSIDIVQLNEMINLHITDSEYALKYMKYGTWVTNCEITGGTSQLMEQYIPGRALPVMTSSEKVVIGPTQVIKLDTLGGEAPYFEWKSPVVDLKSLDEIMADWVYSYASDWSVNLKVAGQGTASSGFQLVVEELDNIDLKKARQKQFITGISELCRMMMKIVNLMTPIFSEDASVNVSFSNHNLPVDEVQDEQVWSIRLREGRASRIEYFMTKFDLTKEQAIARIAEIDAERQAQQVTTLQQMVNAPASPNVQKFMVGA